jgi:hypothetical protein
LRSRFLTGEIFMSRHLLPTLALAGLATAFTTDAFAHCFVGPRFFPATLATDDPCVADEMSLPTVSWSQTADVPPASQLDLEFDFSKRITENFGVTVSQDWSSIRQANGTLMQGFGNFETTFQYQVLKDREHELAILSGVIVDWGRTGSTGSGFATDYSLVTPTLYFGKGFGDLPSSFSWFRAFAVTGQVGYQIPTNSFDFTQNAFIPQQLVYGASLQYSMPYLKSEIIDLGLPDFINHLIPIVELSLTTPVANNFGNPYTTTGTVNPGVIYVGSTYQVGLEALIPVNRASGTGVGVLGQLHLYLDDMFPSTIGQPLFGGTSTTPRKTTL